MNFHLRWQFEFVCIWAYLSFNHQSFCELSIKFLSRLFHLQISCVQVDFIINLSNNNDYTNIMIVINQLMKMRHMISLKSLDIIEVTEIFIQNVFKLHELSDTIISDHEDQFIVTFWKMLCTQLSIEAWLLMTFHFKIDDQTENTNTIMKQYLWMYCSYLQDDWKK